MESFAILGVAEAVRRMWTFFYFENFMVKWLRDTLGDTVIQIVCITLAVLVINVLWAKLAEILARNKGLLRVCCSLAVAWYVYATINL